MIKVLLTIILISGSCSKAELSDQALMEFAAQASEGTHSDKVIVQWSKNDYYSAYQVFRSQEEFGTYEPITPKTSKLSVEDRTIAFGEEYFYYIIGYNQADTPMFTTKPVKGFAGLSEISPPRNLVTELAGSSKSIRLDWTPVTGANGYRIFRAIKGEPLKVFMDVDFSFYEDTTVSPGVRYIYSVASKDEFGLTGARSEIIEGLRLGVSDELSATDGQYSDKIELSWVKADYAGSYNVYRSPIDSEPQFIATVTGTTFTDSDPALQHRNKFYYWIDVVSKNNPNSISDKTRAETGYVRKNGVGSQPVPTEVTQGTHKQNVRIVWMGDSDSYNVYRSPTLQGEYKLIGTVITTSFEESPPTDSYAYFYKIAPLKNTMEGQQSEPILAWTLKAPYNITTSQNYSDKIILSWDSVLHADKYKVYAGDNKGSLTFLADTTMPDYTEKINLSILNEKHRHYKISVVSCGLESDLSEVVTGIARKFTPPNNFNIVNNHTSTEKMLAMTWDPAEGASGYKIYRATFAHKNEITVPENRYKLIATIDPDTTVYRDPLPKVPLRRHSYRITALDAGGRETPPSPAIVGYRYPTDLDEFIRDVDYNIYFTQVQVPNFGAMGLEATIRGRGNGYYEYASKIDKVVNNWRNLVQFETELHGDTRMGITLNPPGSSMDGPTTVSGLYSGYLEYIGIVAIAGGTVDRGSIKASYNHPKFGKLEDIRSVAELNAMMITIRLAGDPSYSQPKPADYDEKHPSYTP